MEYLSNRINKNPKPMDILQFGNEDKLKTYNIEKLFYRNNESYIFRVSLLLYHELFHGLWSCEDFHTKQLLLRMFNRTWQKLFFK